MKVKENGMILLVVLLCFSIMSLLILTQLELVLLNHKSINQFLVRQKNREAMDRFAQQLMKQSSNQWPTHCIITGFINPNQIIGHLNTGHACSSRLENTPNQSIANWGIEDLGIEPCQQYMINNKHYCAHHWRLTLSRSEQSLGYLQIRFISLTEEQICLDQKPRIIQPGVQSWRWWF